MRGGQHTGAHCSWSLEPISLVEGSLLNPRRNMSCPFVPVSQLGALLACENEPIPSEGRFRLRSIGAQKIFSASWSFEEPVSGLELGVLKKCSCFIGPSLITWFPHKNFGKLASRLG